MWPGIAAIRKVLPASPPDNMAGSSRQNSPGVGGAKIPVGISSCLLGEKVRFDGQHKRDVFVEKTLGAYFEFRPFCPEVAIGLGVPRQPIRLVARDDGLHCVSIVDAELDYTAALNACADEQTHWQRDLCGYILKSASPSCGMERVKVYESAPGRRDGVGIYAAALMRHFPDLPVEEEGRLGDPLLRENFIQRVHVMWRWREMERQGLSVAALLSFHARHKLILMSHSIEAYRNLGPLIAGATGENLAEVAAQYFSALMTALKEPASRGRHVNVLQHIQGYLRPHLDAEGRQELGEVFARYQRGEVPLIVPVTLLNHYFRRFPNAYIRDSWYMQPYPAGLSLQNGI